MATGTLDPTEENQNTDQDELEALHNLPSYQKGRGTPTADALQQHFNMPSAQEPVYDKGGNEPTDPVSKKKPGAHGLKNSEENGGEKPDDNSFYKNSPGKEGFYSPEGDQELSRLSTMRPSIGGVFGFARNNRGKMILGGAALGIVTLLIIGFFALIPFKLLHFMNNLQSHYFATAENAVNREEDVLFSQYITKYVLPGLSTCKAGTTIDKTCTPRAIQGKSIISNMYRGWQRAHLENTLAEKYGIEFKKVGAHYFIKTPGMTGNGAGLDDFVHENQTQLFSLDDYIDKSGDGEFTKIGRAEVRQAVASALDGETRYKKTLYRFKVGRLLEEKYGIKRCIVACTARDNFADWKDQKKLAAKAYLIDRVITPRSMALGLVMQCLLAGTDDSSGSSVCPSTTHATPDTTCDAGSCELGGEADSAWEKNLRSEWEAYRATLGNKAADDLLKEVDLIRKNGYSAYLYTKIFGSSAGKDLSKNITNSDPKTAEEFSKQLAELQKSANLIGAINKAANIIHLLDQSGPMLHKMTYITNASTMVAMYSTYRTYADEIKSGNVDGSIVGSFSDTLNSGMQDPQDTTGQIGGTAGAENTPLYGQLFSSQQVASLPSALSMFTGSEALAASQNNVHYFCNDGKAVPAGKLVCNEENLDYNPIASDFVSAFSQEPLSTIKAIVDKYEGIKHGILSPFFSVVNWTLSQLTDFVTKLAGIIPGVKNLEDLATQALGKLLNFLVAQLIPSPISSNMSGGRTLDLLAGGADVAGNDFAHHGLGGEMLTGQQVAEILNDQNSLNNAAHQNETIAAKIFNTNDSASLVSRLAMTVPSSLSGAQASLASLFTNPFKGLSFGFSQAHAATPLNDSFGVTQYGYAKNDPIFQTDPETYWTDNCVDAGQEGNPQVSLAANKETYKWNDSASINQTNFMSENDTTNPCLLIQAAVGSGGALYDSSLLTQDDNAN